MRRMFDQPTTVEGLKTLIKAARSLGDFKGALVIDSTKKPYANTFTYDSIRQRYELLLAQVKGFAGVLKGEFGNVESSHGSEDVLGYTYLTSAETITSAHNLVIARRKKYDSPTFEAILTPRTNIVLFGSESGGTSVSVGVTRFSTDGIGPYLDVFQVVQSSRTTLSLGNIHWDSNVQQRFAEVFSVKPAQPGW